MTRTRLALQTLEDRRTPTNLPAGFTETLVTTNVNLSSPTAIEFSPTGELWALQQTGAVRLIRADGSAHTAITLSVDANGERGLLGIAFDPQYDGTGPNADFINLYYTEPANGADPSNNRLSRFTVTGAGTDTPTLGSEQILRDLPPEAEDGNTNHNGGAIHFGPDGKLYVAVGDHNYDTTPQSQHVSQLLTTPFGKILRLNADGTNSTDNPYYNGSATNWRGSIYALGLRNPYTFAFSPTDGTMFINDVGEGSWEEINRGESAANYGWAGSSSPLWEGFESTPPNWTNYRDPAMAYDHSNSAPTPAGVAITGGAFYPANGPFGAAYAGKYFFSDYGAGFIRVFDPANPGTNAVPDKSTGFATNLTTGAPVDLKVDSAGNLYYLARGGPGKIYRISFAAPIITQQPADTTVGIGLAASLTVAASGANLTYQWQKFINAAWTDVIGATSATFSINSALASDAGQYRAIATNSAGTATSDAATLSVNIAGQAPSISQQASSKTVNLGNPAAFSVIAAGAAPLSYQWQKFDGAMWNDLAGETTANYLLAATTLTDAGSYRVVITNSVGSTTSDAANLTVNRYPTASITAPATYTYGQTINFSATANDPEDGTLPGSACTWRVDFAHDSHFHPHVAEFTGVTSSSFVANFYEPDPDQFYRIVLTVTDSNGATFTTFRDVAPVKSFLTLASNPAGVALTIDGQPVTAPIESVVGIPHTIQAPTTVTVNGTPYNFLTWSDGGAASHSIDTPAIDSTLTANYLPALYAPGLTAEFYDFSTSLTTLPDLTGQTPTVRRTDSQINYALTASAWRLLDTRFADRFAVRHTGQLQVNSAGDYNLFVKSDEGSRVWLDGQLLIDHDGRHGFTEKSAPITLTAGFHDVRVDYFENVGNAGLVVSWAGPGIAKQVIPAANLFHATPVGPRAYRQSATGLVTIEAEDFDRATAAAGKTWSEWAGVAGFTGTGAMAALANTGATRDTDYLTNSPRLDYQVNFDRAGTHYLWVRGRGATTADDSVHIGLDGAAQTLADRVTGLTANYSWTRRTVDGPYATIFVPTPGLHSVNLWMREDGAVVDRILLTPSPTFVPTSYGPPTSVRDLPTLNFGNGFNGLTGLTTSGIADVVGTTLQLTDGDINQAGSAFSTNRVNAASFATSFDFRLTSAVADGFAFVIQGGSAMALGATGDSLGYEGIGNSVAVTFDLFGFGANTTGLYTNGIAPTGGGTDLTAAGLDLNSGHAFRASLAYGGGTLWLTLRDLETGVAVTRSYTVDIPTLVGGNTAFVGFTGSTGSSTATQEILNWAYWG